MSQTSPNRRDRPTAVMSRVEIPQRSKTEVCYRLGGSTDTEALTARNLFLCERACCSFLDP